jgi:DNA-binding MarR family transcriptional regulator
MTIQSDGPHTLNVGDHGGAGMEKKRDFRKSQELPEAAQDCMEALHFMLRPFFKEFRNDMPAQLISTFATIARHPGKAVKEYADMEGVSKSVMSRHILDLGERNRRMEPGFGLVQAIPHPMELRKHEVTLTPKGHRFALEICRMLELLYDRKHRGRR